MNTKLKYYENVLVAVILFVTILLAGCKPISTITSTTSTSTVTSTISSTVTTTSETSTTTSVILPSGTDLEFEINGTGGIYKDETNVPTGIYVLANEQSPLPSVYDSLYPDGLKKIENLDFSQYFVIFVFMGTQGGQGPFIKPERIWQNGNTVYVLADFNDGGSYHLDAISAPSQSVKVTKSTMMQFGKITFILLDLSGKERARGIFNVSQ